MIEKKRLLVAFAHPDDETFGAGSMLARYSKEGVEVTVVCATRGEVGEIKDGSGATRESLGQVREAKLRAAVRLLGVSHVEVLGYRDSGMAGSKENGHPQALVNAPLQKVVEQVAEIIRRRRPQVVVTMDEGGGYGHPDHIRMTEATVQAFRAAADPTLAILDGEPWTPERLYYIGFPRSMWMRWIEHTKRVDPDSDLVRIDPNTMGVADEKFTTVVDVSPYADIRQRAAEEHRSQISPFDRLPPELTQDFLARDHFIRVEPPWAGGPLETDLFQGI